MLLSKHEIHAIFIEHESKPAVIGLSNQYLVEFDDARIRVRKNQASATMFKESRVSSFTTLFGKNGCGKTGLMMELCQTFSEGDRGKPLGVLYSQDGRLYLYRGAPLKRWQLDSDSVGVEISNGLPSFKSIFYTTSPFETARRARLKKLDTLDVSPSFGSKQRFDGLSLIENYQFIDGDAAKVCEELNIFVRGWISRERTVLQIIQDFLDRHAYNEERRLIAAGIALIDRWMVVMPPQEYLVLQANLLIISNVEGNHNVVGRLTGELMRAVNEMNAQGARPGRQDDIMNGRWLVELTSTVIRESNFIRFDGAQVIDYLRSLRNRLGETAEGTAFTVFKSAQNLSALLAAQERESPGLARFLTDLGMLEFELKNLSSGEFAFLYLYAAIGSAFMRLQRNGVEGPVFLLIDEGEMFLHPAWQREYIQNILEFIKKMKLAPLQIHVVISTHSLIVAADSPPKSLFNIELGMLENGFALGPAATLSTVYGVPDFAGENTVTMIDELVNYLSNPRAQTTPRIRKLADAIADGQLKDYVSKAIVDRTGARHA